jgi:spore germination protein YaaH
MLRNKRIILLTLMFLLFFCGFIIIRTVLTDTNKYGDIQYNSATSKYNPNLYNCAWIPEWASGTGLLSLKNNYNELKCISPVLYELNNDGTLKNVSPSNLKLIVEFAKSKNIKIYPTIAMMDHNIFTSVLQNDENLERHINQILEFVLKGEYDGVDLDYESTKYSDNDKYQYFIKSLYSKLHENSKKLIITVLSKWGDNIEYPSLKETRKVQDWSFLSNYADQIRIMAYDYTYMRAKLPGPIAPIDWIERIIQYAKTQIPDEKIVLGVHLYSYQWAVASENKALLDSLPFEFAYDYMINSYDEKANVSSYEYETVQRIIKDNKGELLGNQGENVYIYQKYINDTRMYENRVLVFIDQKGVLLRKKLASQYNIYGICYWRIGNEGNLLKDI